MSSITEYDTQTITFVQANNVTPPSTSSGYASTMTITLPTPMDLSNAEVSLSSLYCYYSWFNISANFINNTLSYTLPNAAGTAWGTTGSSPTGSATYPVFTNSATPTVISDGIYSINVERKMKQTSHCLHPVLADLILLLKVQRGLEHLRPDLTPQLCWTMDSLGSLLRFDNGML